LWDVFDKLVVVYKRSVHSTIGAASFKHQRHIVEIAQYTCQNAERKVKFKSRELVHITKEKQKFAKAYEQSLTTETFRVVEVIDRTPELVCELSD
jgi:ribosomal protein S11